MRRTATIVAAAVTALAIAQPAQSATVQHLTMREARHAAREQAQQLMVPFTESTPTIHVNDCLRLTANKIRCDVSAAGERARLHYRTRVVEHPQTFVLYASHLWTAPR